MVMEHSCKLFFFRKRSFEDRPFGDHPQWDERTQSWVASEATNPFDMLLDDGAW